MLLVLGACLILSSLGLLTLMHTTYVLVCVDLVYLKIILPNIWHICQRSIHPVKLGENRQEHWHSDSGARTCWMWGISALMFLLYLSGAILASNVVFATDKSYERKINQAVGAWCIATKTRIKRLFGVCPVDGNFSSLNSYRAELEVIRSLLYWLHLLFWIFYAPVPSLWKITIWINNTSALGKSNLKTFLTPSQHIGQEFDIFTGILAVREELNLILWHIYVKSHQDNDPNAEPTLDVQLNESCDAHAKLFLHTVNKKWHSRPTAIPPPTVVASLTINSVLVTNNVSTRILDAWSLKLSIVYLQQQQKVVNRNHQHGGLGKPWHYADQDLQV